MSKTIVAACYPTEIYHKDNPIYAMEIIDSDIPSHEWLVYMREKSGILDLKLCHTGWIESWVPKKPKTPKWEDKYERETPDE